MFVTDKVKAKIQNSLDCMDQRASVLVALSNRKPGWSQDQMLQLAAERAFHVAVECATDIGNDIIDALVMRDAGGYGDIIQVLAEEGVVAQDWFHQFSRAIHFRQRLVRDYTVLSPREVEENVSDCATLFSPYADSIRSYLRLVEN